MIESKSSFFISKDSDKRKGVFIQVSDPKFEQKIIGELEKIRKGYVSKIRLAQRRFHIDLSDEETKLVYRTDADEMQITDEPIAAEETEEQE